MKNTKGAALSTKIQSAPLYTIPNSSRIVFFVGTTAEWAYCEERLRAATIVGIDTETRPVFTPKQRANPCSLLQLAVRCSQGKTEVFIIDLLKLPPKVYNGAISKLFLSKQVIKLGQGLFSDLKELVVSYPGATCFTVAKAVVEVNDMSIQLVGAHLPISLQKLAFFYLNKRLTKTMQRSNWNRRPLSHAQLLYAASDALVLIELYDELIERLRLQTSDKFEIDSLTNVLDVHVEPSPKCSLCFEVFETIKLLKIHRKECLKHVKTLELCSICNEMQLLEAEAMKAHVETCGRTESTRANDHVETDSPVEVGEFVVPLASRAKPNKQKRARRESSATEEGEASEPRDPARLPSSKRKGSKRKKNGTSNGTDHAAPDRRARKMSEGSLFQADDIWSALSKDLSRDDGSP